MARANEKRARDAQASVRAHALRRGDSAGSPEDQLVDLLTDLRHYTWSECQPFDELIATSLTHFQTELFDAVNAPPDTAPDQAAPLVPGDLVRVVAGEVSRIGACGQVLQVHPNGDCMVRFRGAARQGFKAAELERVAHASADPLAVGDKVVVAEPGSEWLGRKGRIVARDMNGNTAVQLGKDGSHYWFGPQYVVRFRSVRKTLTAIAESAPDPPPAPPVFKVGDVVQAQRPGDDRFGWFGTVTALATDPPGSLVQFETFAYWYANQFLRPATQHELDSHASDDGPDFSTDDGPDGPFDEPAEPDAPRPFQVFDQVVVDHPLNLLHGARGVVVGTTPDGLVQMKDTADDEILTWPPDYLRHLTIDEFLAGPPRDEEPEEGEL